MVFELHLDETVTHLNLVDPLVVAPDTSVRSVFEQLRAEERGSVSVCKDDRLVGIFTERDALTLIASGADLDVAIETVMTSDPATVSTTDDVSTVIHKLSVGGYRRLPVLDADGKVVGLLKVSTVLHYLVEHFPSFVYNLPPNPKTARHREGA